MIRNDDDCRKTQKPHYTARPSSFDCSSNRSLDSLTAKNVFCCCLGFIPGTSNGDFLSQKDQERQLRLAAGKMAEDTFKNVWDNSEEDAYYRL
jgi:hypothetical protein